METDEISLTDNSITDHLESDDHNTVKSKTKSSREMVALIQSIVGSKVFKECVENTNKRRKSRSSLPKLSNDKLINDTKKHNGTLTLCKRTMSLSNIAIDNTKNQTSDGSTTKKKIRRFSCPGAICLDKRKDQYCWHCHKVGINISCSCCVRSFHERCLNIVFPKKSKWICIECINIMEAECESSSKPSNTLLKAIPISHLCELLKFALERMMAIEDVEPFLQPANEKELPNYFDFIIKPMCLSTLQKNINKQVYGSTVSFFRDCKWILHNSIIYNLNTSKATGIARKIIRTCKEETNDIDICPQCYYNANTLSDSWFTKACDIPHILLWAKLKSFPYWPAKGMSVSSTGIVDVRFFGETRNKARVNIKDCYLYSEKDPSNTAKKRTVYNNMQDALKELELHIKELIEKFGSFHPAPHKTHFKLELLEKQLKEMIPYEEYKGDVHEKSQKQHSYIDDNNSSNDEIMLKTLKETCCMLQPKVVLYSSDKVENLHIRRSSNQEKYHTKEPPPSIRNVERSFSNADEDRVDNMDCSEESCEIVHQNKKIKLDHPISSQNKNHSIDNSPKCNESVSSNCENILTDCNNISNMNTNAQTEKGTNIVRIKISEIPSKKSDTSLLNNSINIPIVSEDSNNLITTQSYQPNLDFGKYKVCLNDNGSIKISVNPQYIDQSELSQNNLMEDNNKGHSTVTEKLVALKKPNIDNQKLQKDCLPNEIMKKVKNILDENCEKTYDAIQSLLMTSKSVSSEYDTDMKMKQNQSAIDQLESKHKLQMYESEIVKDLSLVEVRYLSQLQIWQMKRNMTKKMQERLKGINEIKRKQWCAVCLKESKYHCCWNTSYCSIICQERHQSDHIPNCLQPQTYDKYEDNLYSDEA